MSWMILKSLFLELLSQLIIVDYYLRLIRSQGVSLSSDLVIETPEILCGGAVEVEPPVADEVVLVEESPVGAEEAVLGESTATIIAAYVERLALRLRIGVVAFTKCANVCWDREVGCKHLGCSPRRQNWCREVERILGNQRPLSQELIPLKNRDEIIYNNRKDFFIG